MGQNENTLQGSQALRHPPPKPRPSATASSADGLNGESLSELLPGKVGIISLIVVEGHLAREELFLKGLNSGPLVFEEIPGVDGAGKQTRVVNHSIVPGVATGRAHLAGNEPDH